MRTGNPALGDNTFTAVGRVARADEAMTIQGTANKAILLLLCVLVTASWIWSKYYQAMNPQVVMPWVAVGAIAGFIVAMVTIFKQTWAPVTAPLYALLEGLVIGGLSAIFESQFPGIVIQAAGLTLGTCLALLLAYKSGMIRATENFKLGVVAATGGIALFYLLTMILGFFGIRMPLMYATGWVGIGFSLLVVIIAALNLVLDFDFIEQGAALGAPKFMEWYGAFGLMVTLIWLYLEMLRLLAKLRSRD
ncbi:MAG: Bax inhibitor-1/YccA family protein [Deltaproteobacteria bacterium]|nr:Bax inhibitor-1/YccA family protein [Deltaproteobacteria bacterium]